MTEARRLVITGVVKGVGLRYHMTVMARRLGVTGWVRNRKDGSVEAFIAGSPDAIAAMLQGARTGPSAAAVKQVFVELTALEPGVEGFQQRDTE